MKIQRRFLWLFVVLLCASVAACSKPFVKDTYKPLALTKASVEGIGKEAKAMFERGELTAEQLEKVRSIYTKVKNLHNFAIDALVTALDAGIDPAYDPNYRIAIENFDRVLVDLYDIAVEFNIVTQ